MSVSYSNLSDVFSGGDSHPYLIGQTLLRYITKTKTPLNNKRCLGDIKVDMKPNGFI
jgi:hypothetical protein